LCELLVLLLVLLVLLLLLLLLRRSQLQRRLTAERAFKSTRAGGAVKEKLSAVIMLRNSGKKGSAAAANEIAKGVALRANAQGARIYKTLRGGGGSSAQTHWRTSPRRLFCPCREGELKLSAAEHDRTFNSASERQP
jgi:hypothetical protein